MTESQNLKKIKLKINGMHCASCEVLIERNFKKIPGVEKVNINQADGKAKVYCLRVPNLQEFEAAVRADGYTVSPWTGHNNTANHSHQQEKPDYAEIGVIFLIVMVVYLLLSEMKLIPKLGITDGMSYGFVFMIGLVAAFSTCLAVTGGLLLAIAAKYNEQNPHFSGFQKFKPHIYFNIGRVVSYTILGGVVGVLGSVLTLSPNVNGFITILASAVMLILGFQMLKIFPWLKRFQPKMPKFLGHKVHNLASGESKTGPFVLGASTFFLPCGFTQALQLYVLSRASWEVGALTMLIFSLGTLPALISLGTISSFAKGPVQNYFLKFAGVIVILLGIFNIRNGANLVGINTNVLAAFQRADTVLSSNVPITDGKQIAQMTVTGLSYSPSQFIVKQGIPVEFKIDGRAAQGCAQVIMLPTLGITEYLPKDSIKTIEFTPQETGEIPFRCTMGMTTFNSKFIVVPNTAGAAKNSQGNTVLPAENSVQPANPNAQQLSMDISQERGFYPNTFTVKKGKPVQMNIDAKLQLGGCMSTLVIPEYNVAHYLKLGKSSFTFTPTKTGTLAMTCSMGGRMGEITVL